LADSAEDRGKEYQLMAARRGLVRPAGAGSVASLAMLSALLSIARAEPLTPLARPDDVSRESGGLLALSPPFALKRPSPVLVDVLVDLGRGVRPNLEWHLRLAFQLDYLDLPMIRR